MMSIILRRRRFFRLLAVSPLILSSTAKADQSGDLFPPPDHGIGGTGQSISGETDHGIGGTGVFGTIQRFGSIFVNGHRIAYSPDVPVDIDGVRASQTDLALGQVVRVSLSGSFDDPSARAIHVTSEVIGPVESVNADGIVVLSQLIDLPHGISKPALRPGKVVAVHGIRKPDGTIVASRIERRSARSRLLLRGVAKSYNGRLRVGNLTMDIAAGSFAERRVVVEFERAAAALRVSSLKLEDLVPGLRQGRISIETYGEKEGRSFEVGVGGTLDPAAVRGVALDGHAYVDMSLRAGRLVSPHFQGGQGSFGPNMESPSYPSPGPPDPGKHGPGSESPRGPRK